jgi:hypothetical protein
MNVCDGVCLLHDELELDIIGFKLMSKRSSENEQCSGNLKKGWMDILGSASAQKIILLQLEARSTVHVHPEQSTLRNLLCAGYQSYSNTQNRIQCNAIQEFAVQTQGHGTEITIY